MRIQRSADHRIVPWANGLGITAEVFAFPPRTTDWTWRLNLADVTDDVAFSTMSGVDRYIVVAQGPGMGLVIDGAPEVRVDRLTPPLSFAGDVATTCRLLDGPIVDLNLMIRRGRATGGLSISRVADVQLLALGPETTAAVVLDGNALVNGIPLQVFDAALFGDDDVKTVSAKGGAVVALVTVRETAPANT